MINAMNMMMVPYVLLKITMHGLNEIVSNTVNSHHVEVSIYLSADLLAGQYIELCRVKVSVIIL